MLFLDINVEPTSISDMASEDLVQARPGPCIKKRARFLFLFLRIKRTRLGQLSDSNPAESPGNQYTFGKFALFFFFGHVRTPGSVDILLLLPVYCRIYESGSCWSWNAGRSRSVYL